MPVTAVYGPPVTTYPDQFLEARSWTGAPASAHRRSRSILTEKAMLMDARAFLTVSVKESAWGALDSKAPTATLATTVSSQGRGAPEYAMEGGGGCRSDVPSKRSWQVAGPMDVSQPSTVTVPPAGPRTLGTAYTSSIRGTAPACTGAKKTGINTTKTTTTRTRLILGLLLHCSQFV